MTLYVNDDGTAYHIYSAEENLTLNMAELSSDYQSFTGKYITSIWPPVAFCPNSLALITFVSFRTNTSPASK